jgi:hypothetical protein
MRHIVSLTSLVSVCPHTYLIKPWVWGYISSVLHIQHADGTAVYGRGRGGVVVEAVGGDGRLTRWIEWTAMRRLRSTCIHH